MDPAMCQNFGDSCGQTFQVIRDCVLGRVTLAKVTNAPKNLILSQFFNGNEKKGLAHQILKGKKCIEGIKTTPLLVLSKVGCYVSWKLFCLKTSQLLQGCQLFQEVSPNILLLLFGTTLTFIIGFQTNILLMDGSNFQTHNCLSYHFTLVIFLAAKKLRRN